MSEELSTVVGTDLSNPESLAAAEAELAGAGKSALTNFGAVTPRLDVRQSMTKNPPAGVELGDFFNTITGVHYGTQIEFLVIDAHKGRFMGSKRSPDGRTYSAGDEPVVPDYWPEQYRGKVFADLPEAHERYSEAVNAGEIEWNKGPAIIDAYNFTGFVIGAENAEVIEPFPVIFAIRASNGANRRAANKAGTLLRALPNLWSKALIFETDEDRNKGGDEFFSIVTAGYGREPETQERKAAVEAALFMRTVGFIDPERVERAEGAGDTNDGDAVVPGPKGAQF